MTQTINEEEVLKQYLLGRLSEEEQTALEERLLTADDFFERLGLAEDELIDEYTAGGLEPDDLERFNRHFMAVPERQQKLRLNAALRKYALADLSTVAPGGRESPENPNWGFRGELARVNPRSEAGDRDPKQWPDPSLTEFETGGNKLRVLLRSLKNSALHPYVRMAAAVFIVLGAGLVLYRAVLYRSDLNSGLAALRDAYSKQRPVEARITALSYARFIQTRGGERIDFDQLKHDRAERLLLDALDEHGNAGSEHGLGAFYLADRQFDRALPYLERAVKNAPSNARFHTDLGVAFLEKGKADRVAGEAGRDGALSGSGVENLAKSLEQFDDALQLTPALLEALFDRALCHQEMMLLDLAQEDWKTYVQKDSNSPWAEEARAKLRLLEERRRDVSQTGEQVLQDFLSAFKSGNDAMAWEIASKNRESMTGKLAWWQMANAYANCDVDGKTDEANDMLRALTYLGLQERERVGDLFTSDLAKFYLTIPDEYRGPLQQAHNLMEAGRQSYVRAIYAEAQSRFLAAEESFTKIGDSAEAMFAEYWLAQCHMQLAATASAIPILEHLMIRCKGNAYKWLLERCYYWLSSACFNRNEPSKAIQFGKQSLAAAESLNDTSGVLNASNELMEYYRYLSNYSLAFEQIGHVLPILSSNALGAVQSWRENAIIAHAFSSAGFYAAAADYQMEALGLALMINETSIVSVTYAVLASILGKEGNYPEAMHYAQLACDVSKRRSSDGVGQKMMAFSCLQKGHLYKQQGDLTDAITSYSESIDLYDKLHLPTNLCQAHEGKLLCLAAARDDALMAEELTVVLDLIERYRSKILEESNREPFFSYEQEVYDLAVDFSLSKGDDERAFEYSEQARARSLLDLIRGGGSRVLAQSIGADIVFSTTSQPLGPADIRKRLPRGCVVLQYAVLEDKLVVWLLSSTAVRAATLEIPKRALEEKISRFIEVVSDGSKVSGVESRDLSIDLYRMLVLPIEPFLDGAQEICIVPDKILNYLPYAALMSPLSGRYLVEEHALLNSPSATLFVLCSEMARRKAELGTERLLSVGNPQFDRGLYPSLPNLPSAADEARDITGYYKSYTLLTGRDATGARVRAELGRSEIISFATHYVVDDRSPLFSRLLLARDPAIPTASADRASVLDAIEIYGSRLPRTRLVVLSACQTAVERLYNGEGMIGIARPFIAATVPVVVASLWPAETYSTAALIKMIHKYRTQHRVSVAQALRLAQMQLINGGNNAYRDPYSWACFVAVGGHSTY